MHHAIRTLLVTSLILPLASLLSACSESNSNDTNPGPAGPENPAVTELAAKVALGRQIFFDIGLSSPPVLACATCHSPRSGFADPRGGPVSAGAVGGLFGNRNAPTVAYAAFVPPLHLLALDPQAPEDLDYSGGLFWDGRTDNLEEQAEFPLRNHLEQNEASQELIIDHLQQASYADEFRRIYGDRAFDDTEDAIDYMSELIAAYESSAQVNRFSSRYDRYLAGDSDFTEQELQGLALFEDESKGNCAACHLTTPTDEGGPVLLTDHTYDNIGIPKNEASPFLDLPPDENPAGRDFIDLGLFETTGRDGDQGRFRVPTLRNVALTAPYGHNGFFATLEDIVHFYNVKNLGADFPAAEVPETENRDELGDLQLSAGQEAAIVAFLRTLSDE